MNTPFRNALIISTAVHFLAITPLYGFAIFKEAVDPRKPMVVDYVVLKEPKQPDIVKKPAPREVRETKKMELVKDIAAKPAAKKEQIKKAPVKISPAKSQIAQKTEAKIRSTKDYISYYQLIREKIRQALKDGYRSYYREGDVHLIFTLRADGSLIDLKADESSSTDNETLLDVAVRSVREAAPFHPFPKALSLPKMTFDLIVTFRK